MKNMFLYVIVVAFICLFSFRQRELDAEPLNHTNTTIINGVFVLLIFLSHSTQYFNLPNNLLWSLYRHFQNFCNQWVVVSFLTFSGYGVMKKILMGRGGTRYVRQFPVKRLFKTWLNFAIAIVLFLIVDICLGIRYDALTIIGSFIGLTSVGNSNWYVFAILLMYLLTYICAQIAVKADGKDVGVTSENARKIAIGVTSGALIYFVVAQFLLPSRFSSTVMCYPLGIWIAFYEEKFLNCFLKKRWISIAVLAIILVATYKLRYIDAVMNLASICFALAIVWFLCWFKINSRILEFIGTHAFSIFILQRIPFLMLQTLTPKICEVPMAFVVVSFAVTLAISVAFDKMLKHVDNKIVPLLLEKETPAF